VAKTVSVTLLLLLVGCVVLVGMGVAQSENPSLYMSLVASLVTVVFNMALKWAITAMTDTEGLDTVTEYETSLFGKLSLAYIFNSVLIPIGVGSYFSARVSGVAVTQAWFEPGGVVNQAVFLIVTNGLVCVLQVLQPWELFKRFVLARSVVSQHKLNQLWEPPPMLLGELYASCLKTVALCLIYAPLWPMAYLLTALALLFSYACTKFAVGFWYRKPPMVTEEMMSKLRARLGLLMLLHMIVALIAADASSADQSSSFFSAGAKASAPVTAMFVVWVLYELVDLPDCLELIPALRTFDELAGTASGTEDTEGIPYREVDGVAGVRERLKYDVDEYLCPSVSKYPVDFLLAHHFRDFADDEAEAGGGVHGGEIDMVEVRQPLGADAAPPQPQPTDESQPTEEPPPAESLYPSLDDDVGGRNPRLDPSVEDGGEAPPPASSVARGPPVMSSASTSKAAKKGAPVMQKKGPPVMQKKGPPVMTKKK